MAQLSRPFQILAAAFLVFAGVWLIALRPHSSGTSAGSGTAASASAPSASEEAKHAAAPTKVIHTSVPGVEGLSKAIAKAHGAVATSQQNAKQLEEKAAQASSPSAAGSAPATSAAAPSTSSASSTPSASAAVPTTAATPSKSAAPSSATTPSTSAATPSTATQAPVLQQAVEAELQHGKIAVILFWNPHGAEDNVVLAQTRKLPKSDAVFDATAEMVADFGTITRGVQVDQTPTLLIVNKKGLAKTITGLTDVFSINQAIAEARNA